MATRRIDAPTAEFLPKPKPVTKKIIPIPEVQQDPLLVAQPVSQSVPQPIPQPLPNIPEVSLPPKTNDNAVFTKIESVWNESGVDDMFEPITNGEQRENTIAEPEPDTSYNEVAISQLAYKQNQKIKIPTAFTAGLPMLAPGAILFLVGLYYAVTSKSATDFDSFYWNIIVSNVLMSGGMVFLYHGVSELIGGIKEVWLKKK